MSSHAYGAPDPPAVPSKVHTERARIVRRIAAPVLALALAVGLVGPAGFLAGARVSAAAPVPRVVIIVGPSGRATDGYRAEARAAAAVARQYTPDVIELYSPDATWPAVRQALDGASLVIYMGHGNGWPSHYRDHLYPVTQNGFGLNPKAGGDDATHQYFGEAAIAAQITLAPNAVVLLNHLCYASGLSEPGLPEGTLDEAQQRIDNFAAGFIKAGAAAVVAEAWSSPSYMVRSILGGGRSIERAWRSSPAANGHRLAFESRRSPGFVAEMDTETPTAGFTRSIVLKAGLAPSDVLAGARGSAAGGVPVVPGPPSLVASGIKLATPDIHDLTSAGTPVTLDVPYSIADRKDLPKVIGASVRWDPIAPLTSVVDGSHLLLTPGAYPTGWAPAAAVIIPAPPPDAADPSAPGLDLVVPERLGDVVAPTDVKIGKRSIGIPLALPTTPGRYRLSVTLHDPDGVVYDAVTQALLPSLIVRVTGDFDGAIVAASAATLTAGTQAVLETQVRNLGSTAWGHPAIAGYGAGGTDGASPAAPALLVATWIPITVASEPDAVGTPAPVASAEPEPEPEAEPVTMTPSTTSVDLPIGLGPGDTATASLDLDVPTTPGTYLLLLDVVTPERGSLLASGADPTFARVTVVEPAP